MLTHTEAADTIRNIAGKFKGILELAAFLEQAGSIEQAIREAGPRLDKLREEIAEAEAQVEKARQEAMDINEQASAKQAAAQEAADKVLADARAEFDAAITESRRRAEGFVQAGKDEAARLLADEQAKIQSARDELSAVRQMTADAKNERDQAAEELKAINAQLAQAKAAVQKLLGA